MATSLTANKTENLNKAKDALLVCFNQKTFANLADIPFADVFDVAKKATNAEIIFQIVHKQGDASLSSALARNNQAKGETINSLFVAQGTGGLFTNDLLKEFETIQLILATKNEAKPENAVDFNELDIEKDLQ
jgi:hypothetical protein